MQKCVIDGQMIIPNRNKSMSIQSSFLYDSCRYASGLTNKSGTKTFMLNFHTALVQIFSKHSLVTALPHVANRAQYEFTSGFLSLDPKKFSFEEVNSWPKSYRVRQFHMLLEDPIDTENCCCRRRHLKKFQ